MMRIARSLSARTHASISTISPTACCASSPARSPRRRAATCPRTPSWWRATWGRPISSIMTAPSSGASSSRTAERPAMSPSWRGPSAFRPSARSPGIIDLVDTGDAHHRRRPVGRGACAPVGRASSAPMRTRCASMRASRRSTRHCATRPAITRDGVRISLSINAGLLVDLPHLHESGADGIGLFRTELQFMMAQRLSAARAPGAPLPRDPRCGERQPVMFRTLDIGADKSLPYLRQPKEDNPAMGWRAIRMSLERPALMQLQLRALLKAAAGREPPRHVPDDRRGIGVRGRQGRRRRCQGGNWRGAATPCRGPIRLGTMIEVPVAHLAARPAAARPSTSCRSARTT